MDDRIYEHAERISALETTIEHIDKKLDDLTAIRESMSKIAIMQFDITNYHAENLSLQNKLAGYHEENVLVQKQVADNLVEIRKIQDEQKDISKEFAKVVPALEKLSKDVGEIKPKVAHLEVDMTELKTGVEFKTEKLKSDTTIKKEKMIMWTALGSAAIALIGTVLGFIF